MILFLMMAVIDFLHRKALRGRFIQTLSEKSIVIQNIRGQWCDRAARVNDNG